MSPKQWKLTTVKQAKLRQMDEAYTKHQRTINLIRDIMCFERSTFPKKLWCYEEVTTRKIGIRQIGASWICGPHLSHFWLMQFQFNNCDTSCENWFANRNQDLSLAADVKGHVWWTRWKKKKKNNDDWILKKVTNLVRRRSLSEISDSRRPF